MTQPANDAAASGCLCVGRAEGKHGLLCEHVLRGAFGSVANAPEDLKHLMREQGRLVTGTVIAGEVEAPDGLECLACSDLDHGACRCTADCGHLNCTGGWR